MKTGTRGIELIKQYEGFMPNAYEDIAGVITIGYGHTKTAKIGQVITPSEAQYLLKNDLIEAEDGVLRLVKVSLTQSMFDALVSFVFNLGAGNLQESTLLRVLNSKAYLDCPEQFCRWKYASGKPVLGLIRRRIDEAKLFLEDGLIK